MADAENNPVPQIAGDARQAPPPPARTTRRTMDAIAEVTVTVDAFATPSDSSNTTSTEPVALAGPEPAIFGGVNPAPLPDRGTPEVAAADDDETTPGQLLPAIRRTVASKILHSNVGLTIVMLLMMAGAAALVITYVEPQTYVQATVGFRNYRNLPDDDADEFQKEINALLRTYPLRLMARETLLRTASHISPGVLDSGSLFQGNRAVEWSADGHGRLALRIDSQKPADDIVRMGAALDAFARLLQERQPRLEQARRQADNLQVHVVELKRQKAELDQQPALNTNDAEFRKTLEQRLASAEKDLAAAQRVVALWVDPEPIDPTASEVIDTRPLVNRLIWGLWAGIVFFFAYPMWMNYRAQRAETARLRQERRARGQRVSQPPASRAAKDSPRR